jgi:hypothetical protein
MRDYYQAQEAKAAGLDWRSALLADGLGDDDEGAWTSVSSRSYKRRSMRSPRTKRRLW